MENSSDFKTLNFPYIEIETQLFCYYYIMIIIIYYYYYMMRFNTMSHIIKQSKKQTIKIHNLD